MTDVPPPDFPPDLIPETEEDPVILEAVQSPWLMLGPMAVFCAVMTPVVLLMQHLVFARDPGLTEILVQVLGTTLGYGAVLLWTRPVSVMLCPGGLWIRRAFGRNQCLPYADLTRVQDHRMGLTLRTAALRVTLAPVRRPHKLAALIRDRIPT